MRILIVSFAFPPYNTIGAVRVGSTAAHLLELGHDVRVISARDQVVEPTLESRFPAERVVYTPWLDVNRPVSMALGGRARTRQTGYAVPAGAGSVVRGLGRMYKTMINFPDGRIGWLPYAARAGAATIGEWRPDLIFASGLPWTALIVARGLARRHGIPWVAELRDLWVDGPLYEYAGTRRRLESRLERAVLGSAAGLVTVSELLAQRLRARFSTPVADVLNGFDPEAYPPADPPVPGPLRIVYCGMIYEGKRDPTPLFRAIRLLGPLADQVRVSFYGRYMGGMEALVRREGVGAQVEVHEAVPHRESLRLQQEADALLLLMWDGPDVEGDYTGKFFEYVGAARPILALGPRSNVACRTILERGAGAVLQEPEAIAEQLRTWIAQKQATGTLPAPPPEAAEGFTRRDQTRRLEAFLAGIARNPAGLAG
jgi:glycosyltransferase involved in cell wall biosynthesis